MFLIEKCLCKNGRKNDLSAGKGLFTAMTSVKRETLKNYVHLVWIKVFKDLIAGAKNISEIQDIKKQREPFKSVSKNTYKLIKVSKFTEPVYY